MSDYTGALEAVDRVVNRESEADEVLRQTVEVLHDRFEHYSWVGIYLVEEGDLVLGPWKGPQATDHVRIPIGQGVCGAAAASGKTEIVDDVAADERYLSCFPSTRSEVVVPIIYEGKVVGVYVVDDLGPAARRCCATDSLADRDPDVVGGLRPLPRPEHEVSLLDEVDADP